MANNLYNAEGCRAADEQARQVLGVSGFTLMTRAAREAYDVLLQRYPQIKALSVWCGKGNNGGDAYLLAAMALQFGLAVQLVRVAPVEGLSGDALAAHQYALLAGLSPVDFNLDLVVQGDVIVDGLLGTGAHGAPRAAASGPHYAGAIVAMNASGAPILAIDVPSGVDVSSGGSLGVAVQADVTVTFITQKVGLATGVGLHLAGDVVFASLGVPPEIYPPTIFRRLAWRHAALAPLNQRAYKHEHGHALVIGGATGMAGAIVLASRAALRAGVGLASVVTLAEHAPMVIGSTPEAMVVTDLRVQLDQKFSNANVLVLGPGLGREDWATELYRRAESSGLPTVLDADGLYHLAQAQQWQGGRLFITPHSGEAARLLQTTPAAVEADRLGSAQALADRFNADVALKGPGTVVASIQGAKIGICQHGNPGMASAGMGDVLAGLLGGLLAGPCRRGEAELSDLFAQGVALHSAAGDHAALRVGQRSLLASDVIDALPELLRPDADSHQSSYQDWGGAS